MWTWMTTVVISTLFIAFFVISFIVIKHYGSTFEEKVRILTMIGAIVVALGGIYKFFDDKYWEAKKHYAEKQLDVCLLAADAAAAVAAQEEINKTEDTLATNGQRRAWKTSMYGSLAVIEDDDLAKANDKFDKLTTTPTKKDATSAKIDAPENPFNRIQNLKLAALDIASKCRAMVSREWEEIGPVPKLIQEKIAKAPQSETTGNASVTK